MRVLVTGANGFVGKNLIAHLSERDGVSFTQFSRSDSIEDLSSLVSKSDAIVHLAGANRPVDESDFYNVNVHLTDILCENIKQNSRKIPLIFASSTQAELDNPYGRSKAAAEALIERLFDETGNPVLIYRLTNVFGKWCKPNYNSVVATFCHNIVNELPISIDDSSKILRLVYIDDVIEHFFDAIERGSAGISRPIVQPEYSVSVGDLAQQLQAFKTGRATLQTGRVGLGFGRALYATYTSHLDYDQFSYEVPRHSDERGVFVEMLKTLDSGQISYFTAFPGVVRGGHYHHSKTEKFLVIKGYAKFGFRNVITDETRQLRVSGKESRIVESAPGWSHDITNVGEEEMVVLLWANENFDPDSPDTINYKV
ncbi:NAD-dependent epimerase/dehydratase family protein [Gammaproteobacteria bacterium]|nr:NAD-dependent epimerase/dehydratase family protein [Gammaproteobacteria bacterium]